MANTGFKGIFVRQTGNQIVFRELLLDATGALVTTGTTNLYLYEWQSTGTLSSYDFNDNTFKTGALTTETQAMTHRQGNNNTTNTGLWSFALSTLTGFTFGAVYLARVNNTNAYPNDTYREFQYGSLEGDQSLAKNVALNNFEFVMRSSSDHTTPTTGLTVTGQRSIDGAAFAACANSVFEVGDGVYKINLAASDLAGSDITLRFTATGADPTLITLIT